MADDLAGVSREYRAIWDSIRNGGPGLSDATVTAIARSAHMKTALLYGTRLRASEAATAAAVERAGWQDIRTAPRDLVVQMYEPHSQGGFMFAGCVGVDGTYRDNLQGDAHRPTHWQPLPAPPALPSTPPVAEEAHD